MATAFFPELPARYSSERDAVDLGPDAGSTDAQVVRFWCESAYEEARSDLEASEELKFINKYQDYLGGRQWTAGRPTYRSKPVDNRMFRLFWELVSLLTDIRPTIAVKAVDRTPPFMDQETTINKAMKAWWLNTNADERVAMTVAWSVLTTGFAKWQWNQDLYGGMGDLECIPVGPTQLMPLKPQFDLQSSQAVIYETVQPTGLLRRKFPRRTHLIVPDPDLSRYSVERGAPPNVPMSVWNVMQPGLKRILGGGETVAPSAYPMTRLREFWMKDYTTNTSRSPVTMGDTTAWWGESYVVQPGERLYPRGRLISMCGRNVVDDRPNPFWHGMFPFTMCRLNVVPWQFYGMSDLRSVIDLQDIVNQILAGVIDLIKKAVNPGFFAPKNAFSENVWENLDWSQPGARAAFSPSSAHEPKFAPSPPIPPAALNVLQMVYKEMDQQSLGSMAAELSKKKQVPSGDSLDQFRNVQSTPVRLKGRNIQTFLQDSGQLQIPNIFQFYTSSRRLFLPAGRGGVVEDIPWEPGKMFPGTMERQDYVRRFKFYIEEGSMLSIEKTDRLIKIMAMRARGDLDRRTMYELIDEPVDIDKIEARLKQERSEGIPMLPPGKTNKKGMMGELGKR